MDYVWDTPFLLRRLCRILCSRRCCGFICNRFFLMFIFYFFGALAYIISPFDIIPEAIFGLVGYIDDIMVFAGMFVAFARIIHNFICNNERLIQG